MKKRLFVTLISAFLALALSFTAAASQEVIFDTMVLDMAEVLSPQEAQQLEAEAWDITNQYNCAVYIVTTNDLEGYEPWQYSEIMQQQLEMGYGSDQSCIILLLAINSRDYNIMARGYGNTAFTDYGKEVMSERFLDEFGNDDWYGGFTEYLDCSREFLQMARDGQPFDIDTDSDPIFTLFICAAIGFVIAFIVCGIFWMQMKTAKRQTGAAQYINDRGMVLTAKQDRYISTTRTERYIPPQNKNGGRKGGTTVNSRGNSHRGGKF